MNKKNKEFEVKEIDPNNNIEYHELNSLSNDFYNLLNTDPKYSLEVDPTNRYNFSDKEKDFIAQMVQYKNVQFVSMVMLSIPLEEGVEIYKSYNVQQEIKRINLAMYARRFATKMADLDQLGGFLTSGLVDENVPVSERWGAKEKLTATKMLINLNVLKREGLHRPDVVEEIEIQKDLDKLSPNDLKRLIEYNEEDNEEEKEKLIDIINKDNMLSLEELKNLRVLTIGELQELADLVTKNVEEKSEPVEKVEDIDEEENNEED